MPSVRDRRGRRKERPGVGRLESRDMANAGAVCTVLRLLGSMVVVRRRVVRYNLAACTSYNSFKVVDARDSTLDNDI
jgi:hypothetical protein